MRYEKGHRTTTKQRLVEIASKRFRQNGFAGVGLTGVMQEAGLTNGGFYVHFDSKETLVAEGLAHALDARQAEFSALAESDPADALEVGVRMYLNAAHRDTPGDGCPSAALLPEIGRHSDETRAVYERRFAKFVDLIEGLMPGQDPVLARSVAMATFGLLVGTLQLARAVATPRLSDEILESGVQAALTLAKSLTKVDKQA